MVYTTKECLLPVTGLTPKKTAQEIRGDVDPDYQKGEERGGEAAEKSSSSPHVPQKMFSIPK